MILFSKLKRTDLILLTAVVVLIGIQPGGLKDGLTGFVFALFVLSIIYHISQYKLNKKFY